MKLLSAACSYIPPAPRTARRGLGKKSIAEELKAAYAAAYYESGRLETLTSIRSSPAVKTIKFKDLEKNEIDGYPCAIDRDEQGGLQCHFPVGVSNAHELIIGSTGSGKTTSLVEPRIRALSTKKNKASLFVSDPKGELFLRHADYLRSQNYRVYVLNFKDVLYSDSWNPLEEVYHVWMRQAELKKSLRMAEGEVCLDEHERQADETGRADAFWVCGGKTFPSEEAAKRWYNDQLGLIHAETADLIHQLVHAFIPDIHIASHDPSWGLGARDILAGLIYLMLEDALDERTGFTLAHMNLINLQNYYECIRSGVMRTENVPLLQFNKLKHKSNQDISIQLLRNYLNNAPSTSRSYAGVFRNAMQEWFSPKIFTITSHNSLDISEDGGPLAIFLITRDSEQSDFVIAGMVIDWIYRKLLEQADGNGGRLKNEFYFLLDEFSNIPKINDFTNKITSARSRNISFHMILQSYAQLNAVYEAGAQVITDNSDCVFLGSKDFRTKERFSKECGRRTVPCLDSVLNSAVDRMAEIPIVTISRLEELQQGQMYLRRTGMPLLFTRYEPSFLCPEFAPDHALTPKEMGIRSVPYNSEEFLYPYLATNQTLAEYCRTRNLPGQVEIEPEFLKELWGQRAK